MVVNSEIMNMKPRLYDLCCKAGGCTKGYQEAGFYVIGVDIETQPRYIGDEFIQMCALEFLSRYLNGEYPEAAAFSASPPCQRYSIMTPTNHKANHPDLIEPIRKLLQATGKPYVIENVAGARHLLNNPLMLCGSMFGLNLWRHRYFEIWPEIFSLLSPCSHDRLPVLITGTTRRKTGRFEYTAEQCRQASGIDWMTRKELDEAIPPAYTHFIGIRLLESMAVSV